MLAYKARPKPLPQISTKSTLSICTAGLHCISVKHNADARSVRLQLDKAEHGDMFRVSSMLQKHPHSYGLMGMSQSLKTVGPKPSQQIEIMTLSN